MRRGNRGAGFTLVELLVVVSIIALLISILLPSLRGAREQSKSVKCLAHARGMAQAGMTFASDHRDRFQLVADLNGNTEADPQRKLYAYGSTGELLGWPVALGQVTTKNGFKENWNWGIKAGSFSDALTKTNQMKDDFALATCPSDKVRVATPFYPNSTQLTAGTPANPAPTGGDLYWGFLSYGINEDIVGASDKSSPYAPVGHFDTNKTWQKGQSVFGAPRLHGDMSKVFDPATALLISDAGADDASEANSTSGTDASTRKSDVVNLIISAQASGPLLWHSMDIWPQRVPIKRHPKGAINVLFADFHGATAIPTNWGNSTAVSSLKVPKGHSTMVRISPYKITGRVRTAGP
jgi:prepilin-type N-terminal cleavage/methylation domain-containing protein/prepilin-type processing-associated H-X9-DG protein